MFNESEETTRPNTILSSESFLLLQEYLLLQIRQASMGIPFPPETALQAKDGLLWYKDKIFVPENLQVPVLEFCHDHMLARHFGVYKTSELLQCTFWWLQVEKDCKKYV